VLAGLAASALTAYSSMTSLLLQILCPPDMRGRLLAFYTFMFWGIQPISSIGCGLVADRVGPQAVLGGLAVATVAWVAIVALAAPVVRRLDVDADGKVVDRGEVSRPASAPS
jgi:hypothetical protein